MITSESGACDPDAPLLSDQDVEREVRRMFETEGSTHLVVRVQGEGEEQSVRTAAFRDLLLSLRMYDERPDDRTEIMVDMPSKEVIARGLNLLGRDRYKRTVYEQALRTFGSVIIDPIAQYLDPHAEGELHNRMLRMRTTMLEEIQELSLTPETRHVLDQDLRKLLTDEYLAKLAEQEERVERPRAKRLAMDVLRLVGGTFQRAFSNWSAHAETIAGLVTRRMVKRATLRESPIILRDRIIDALEEFLWIETGTELEGALHQLFQQHQRRGLVEVPRPNLERAAYRDFALACWEIVSENC